MLFALTRKFAIAGISLFMPTLSPPRALKYAESCYNLMHLGSMILLTLLDMIDVEIWDLEVCLQPWYDVPEWMIRISCGQLVYHASRVVIYLFDRYDSNISTLFSDMTIMILISLSAYTHVMHVGVIVSTLYGVADLCLDGAKLSYYSAHRIKDVAFGVYTSVFAFTRLYLLAKLFVYPCALSSSISIIGLYLIGLQFFSLCQFIHLMYRLVTGMPIDSERHLMNSDRPQDAAWQDATHLNQN